MKLRRLEREGTIGRGREAFARAREALFAYKFYPPRLVSAPGPVVAGMVLRQRIRVGPLRFDAPVRVTDWWDEPTRAGYRYEALAGHPERGVASFELTLVGEEVRLRIASDSAPAHWLARLGAPIALLIQRHAYNAAFKSMRAAAQEQA